MKIQSVFSGDEEHRVSVFDETHDDITGPGRLVLGALRRAASLDGRTAGPIPVCSRGFQCGVRLLGRLLARADPFKPRARCAGGDVMSRVDTGPHEYQPDGFWGRLRGRCRACYFPPSEHPLNAWVRARPLGDKRVMDTASAANYERRKYDDA